MTTETKLLRIELPLEQMNVVMAGLGKLLAEQSYNVIAAIGAQLAEQTKDAPPAPLKAVS